MENFSWCGQPLQQFLDESPNSAYVIQVAKALVQVEKYVKVAELRLQLERLIQRQYVEYKRTFNAEILNPLLSSELAAKLFHKLGGVGIVLYGYIHHKEGLEAQVLELDDEVLDDLIGTMGKFLKVEKENQNPGILGIELWLSFHDVNACSDILPEDLRDDKNKQKIIQNVKRRLRRKKRHGSEPSELESFDGSPTRLHRNTTILQQHTSNITNTSSYRSPYLPHAA